MSAARVYDDELGALLEDGHREDALELALGNVDRTSAAAERGRKKLDTARMLTGQNGSTPQEAVDRLDALGEWDAELDAAVSDARAVIEATAESDHPLRAILVEVCTSARHTPSRRS